MSTPSDTDGHKSNDGPSVNCQCLVCWGVVITIVWFNTIQHSLTFSAPRTRIKPSYTHSADAFTGNARSRDGPRPRKYPLYPSEACIRRMVARNDSFALVCGVAIIRLEDMESLSASPPTHHGWDAMKHA